MNEKRAAELLRKHAPSEEALKAVLNHSKKVQKIALRIAKDIRNADLEFIKAAALLHDIGRFKHPFGKNGIRHGIEGAGVLRKEGLEKYARVAERHIGAGITKEDIRKQKLGLPLRDYVPKTIEEKIIAHADNLEMGQRPSFKRVIERYKKELGKEHTKRIIKLKEEIDKIKNKNVKLK